MKPFDHHNRGAVGPDLKVRVDRIGDEGVDLDEGLVAGWLNDTLGSGSPYKAATDGRIAAHLEKVERIVRVRGRVQVTLASSCVRCLVDVPLTIDVPLEVTIFPAGEEPAPTEEGELSGDDMGVATYQDDEIDLANLVHDEVFLELPMNVLCCETCAGLCPKCGKNLNEGRCSCAPDVDLRWESLRGIKS
jgi:uncharacterized protein